MGAVREAFLAAYRTALRAVDPYRVTKGFFSQATHQLTVGGEEIDPSGGVRILAVGKGAHGMVSGALAVVGPRLVEGLIIADHHRPAPHPLIRVMVGDHPYPGRASLAAGRAALRMVQGTGADELLLVLVSGGGSSLMEVPAAPMTFDDLQKVGRVLVTGGVPITKMNIVRRHLSAVKNGGLARATGARLVATLLISDVVDGPASAIASGPTLADGTTPAQARAVLGEFHLEHRVPPPALEFLRGSPASVVPSRSGPHQVIADGALAARAAHRELRRRGLVAQMGSQPMVGEAGQAARLAVERSDPGKVDVYWGETTVRIETDSPGRGGRNQHAALVASGLLAERGRGVFGGFATDGIDGRSQAAGGLVDSGTVTRGRQAGLDRGDHLLRFDSSPYLEASGDLVTTGPTGANVGDLWLVAG